ncbi:glutamine ABC transporter substrate-binding protein [Halobacillus shinanisalinarum]|uniref:Glutamine ABC transporter substrate-binding protein n=1 Tax=Halobacillus shinanisalinarum TaxID=2932258 RepID=A0ABY4H2T7_9BACI|nr:glutamine ABC transporter substrate-binding protein [Halobacillus shinanisalinarum]UOQ94473.1 glutamine ABC transporter substrate-binding protein [Halobacillus shinanisalinarum]
MTRKSVGVLLIGLLVAIVISGCSMFGSGDTYTVATDNNFVPFEFMNEETGEMEGFDIDLIKAVAKEAGFDIEIESMKFDGVVAGMQSERYDIGIAGMTITEERKETIDFSDPYYDAGLMLAVQESNNEIKSEADLAGKKVATRSGTTSETYLKENHPDAEVVTFPGIVEAYMDLQTGRVDAVMYDVPNVKYYVANDADGTLKTVGDILQGEQYGIAFPKDSELVEDVNKALQTLKDNGTYDDIYEEWFGERKYGTEG